MFHKRFVIKFVKASDIASLICAVVVVADIIIFIRSAHPRYRDEIRSVRLYLQSQEGLCKYSARKSSCMETSLPTSIRNTLKVIPNFFHGLLIRVSTSFHFHCKLLWQQISPAKKTSPEVADPSSICSPSWSFLMHHSKYSTENSTGSA